MMATAMSQEYICSLVEDGTLELETEAGSKPDCNGVVVSEDILLVKGSDKRNLHLYSLNNGTLLSSHRLESFPMDVCLISKTEVAVCLYGSKIVIVSFKSIDDVKRVKTLNVSGGFEWCHSVAKWNSHKLLVSGVNYDSMLCWGVVSITDGRVDSTHIICEGIHARMAIKDNTVYISCLTRDFFTQGVYAYDILNPRTHKFLYQDKELIPGPIMADRNSVFVCDRFSSGIHQLTDSGQLVAIHTLSSIVYGIFYDDQHGVLYTTRKDSNVITLYKMEYLPAIPAEVLKMDTRSLQMYKEALNEGKEKVYSIRVMVVGQYGVGKTTLTQRLLGKNVNISKRNTTDGIDVNVECCKVSLPAGEWTTQGKNAEQYSRLQRLVKILNERAQKQEFKSEQERQGELDHQVTRDKHDNAHPQHDQSISKEHDIGHPQHDQPASAEPDSNQEVKPPSSQPAKSSIVRVSSEASSGIKSKEKDTMMEILQLVNENSGNLEKSTMEYAALALWDFAGQYVFYTTHQTFLTSRAVYLLVIDLSQQVTDLIKDDECFIDTEGIKLCKVHELIEIWLNSIHSCTPSSHSGIPPVILVGTHVDKIPEKFRKKIIDEYFMKIREMLKNKQIFYHVMDTIAIDNTQCDPRLEDLKRRIFQLASQQPHWGEEKPARWLPLEQAIMTLKASGVKVAPLALIVEINRSTSVKIEDRNELEVFLNFQHEIGTILYFSADGLRDKIILDPQWMIDALKSLITAQMFIMQNPAITEKWFAFKEKGKLTHELIDAIWTKQEKPDFHDNKEHILCVMEKLNIIARPMSYSKDGKLIKEEGCYLAPCMLREATPKQVISPESDSEKESTTVLCFVSKGKFLPPPVFHRLIGACLTHWPIAKQKSKYLIYCGCCVFDLDHHHRLTLHFFGHVIFARVTRQRVKDISQCSELCTEARKFIFENLLKMSGNLGQSLQFEPHIQCPDCGVDSLEGLIAVTTLQKYEEVVCHSHDESHTLLSQQLLQFWYEDERQVVVECRDTGKGSKISGKSELASTSTKKELPTEWNLTVNDLHEAWQSVEVFLSEEFDPKDLLPFFEKERFLSADECEDMRKLRRRQVVKELLHKIRTNLPETFSSFLHALNETKQQVIVQGLRQQIEGTHDTTHVTHDEETNVAYYTLTLELFKDGNLLQETESKIGAYLEKGHIFFDYDMQSQCLKCKHGSVIIYFRPLKELTKKRLELFCQYGGMRKHLLDLLMQEDIFSSLPEGEMSIQVQVHCYDEDIESEDGQYKEPANVIAKPCLSQHFTVTESPQVIKINLLHQYNDIVDEIDPLLFKDTFVTEGICDSSFFEEHKLGNRKERATRFLKRVLEVGDTALAALAHTARMKKMYYLFNTLCIAKEISSQTGDKGQADTRLIDIIQEDPKTQSQEPILWSCQFVLAVEKNAYVKLHRTVLNKCLPELMKELDVKVVMMYIQQKELLDDVSVRDIWDILEQKTSSEAIARLIQLIQQRDQYTYEQFKECLVLARQADLKVMLEEEEANLAPDIKGNHQGTDMQDNVLSQVHDMSAEMKCFPSKLYQSRGVPCSDPEVLCQILIKSQQDDSSSQSTLEVNCLSMGLELHGETPADGNCFFEAVSSQLRRLNCVVQKSPQQLRHEVVAFIKTNIALHVSEGTIDLASFIYNESFDAYCTRMARDGEWADHVVVVAMARMLQIDIMIVTSSPSSGPEDMIVWVVGETVFQGDPIILGHVWESHYHSLQPIASSTFELKTRQHTPVTPTLVAQTTHSPKIQTSSIEVSSTSALTTKSAAPPTTTEQITQSLKIQTSTAKDSTTTIPVTKRRVTSAPPNIKRTPQSPKVQASTPEASATAAPVTKALATVAPTTAAQTTQSSNPMAAATKASTAAQTTQSSNPMAPATKASNATQTTQSSNPMAPATKASTAAQTTQSSNPMAPATKASNAAQSTQSSNPMAPAIKASNAAQTTQSSNPMAPATKASNAAQTTQSSNPMAPATKASNAAQTTQSSNPMVPATKASTAAASRTKPQATAAPSTEDSTTKAKQSKACYLM